LDYDTATQALTDERPYFAYRYTRARYLLNRVSAANGKITFADGHMTDGAACTCQEGVNQVCLHQLAWRIAHYDHDRS
jgi:hypothetical protein